LNPESAVVHYQLAKAYHLQEKLQLAVPHYREVIRRQPRHVEAYVKFSRLLMVLGRSQAASDCLRRALRQCPDDRDVLRLLPQALRDCGEFDAAIECLEKIVQSSPESAEAHFNLGLTLEDQGKLDEAFECFGHALRLNPRFTQAAVSRAGIMEKKGQMREAYEIAQPLAEAPDAEVDAVVLCAGLERQLGQPAEAVDRLQTMLRRKELTNKWRIVAHTQLGQLHDSLGQYEQAFSHFRNANQLKPGNFDIKRHARMIDQIIIACGHQALASLPRARDRGSLPVFIVGMPRSGTSLVEQILASHPQVFGAGELTDIDRLAETLPSRLGTRSPFPQCLNELTQHVVDQLADEYLSILRALSSTARYVTDKMPHNYFHVGFIRLLFPTAPIVHCRRDWRDTCLSCYFSNFLASQTFANDLTCLRDYYQQYEKLMRHWDRTLEVPMFEVCYEDLVHHPEPICRELISDLGLEWDEQCLRFHQSDRFMNTASYQQVRRPIYTKSVGRWRNYEKFLGPLLQALGDDNR
jgi:tetratricopeptide (TPR) repeat protein